MQLLAVPVQRDEMYCQSGLVTLRRQGKRCDAGCWCWGASGDVLTQLGGCVNMATRPCVGAAAVSVGRAGWLVAGALRECVCVCWHGLFHAVVSPVHSMYLMCMLRELAAVACVLLDLTACWLTRGVVPLAIVKASEAMLAQSVA